MPVLKVRKGIQTVAFLGPVAALVVLANKNISPPLALLCMTAALGITSLGEWVGWWRWDGFCCQPSSQPLPALLAGSLVLMCGL